MTDYKEKEYTRDSIVVPIAGNFDEDRFCSFLEGQFTKLRASKEPKQAEPMPYKPDFKALVKEIQQSHSALRRKLSALPIRPITAFSCSTISWAAA